MSTVISSEKDLEQQFIEKLCSLKYEYRPDIRDRAALEKNFRERFQTLNHVSLTDSEFARLLEEVITPDVFTAAKTLRQITSFTRDDGTPLNYTLVNIKDWCKNRFEVVNQLRMNTDYSHHRYDVILLINGVPVVQVELKTLGVNPRRAMEQIVEYKNDPANASLQKIEDTQASMRTTEDLFQNQLHAYTITHAIEDQNVLRFHVDYFKPSPGTPTSPSALSKSMPTRTSALPAPTKRAVTEAILAKHDAATGGRRFNALFSGEKTGEQAREIWLVDKAPVVIDRLKAAKLKLDGFMQSQGLEAKPEAVPNLKGDAARAVFINHFKEIQRLQTQLDQYTDLTPEQKQEIGQTLPKDDLRGFRGVYLETAQRLKTLRETPGFDDRVSETPDMEYGSQSVDQIDFEFVLFASADIDYDYIMGLIAKFSAKGPGKSKMTRQELIGLISADVKFMNERDDIAEYIGTLKAGEGLSETAIREGYTRFKAEKNAKEIAAIAEKHGLPVEALQTFVDGILDRMIFDGEQLSDLMAPLDLGWKARTQAELALMGDLHPLLVKRAGGREISGLSAYEQ